MYEGLYDVRKGLADDDARIVGAMTARLVSSWARWVHRRVERVTFCDADALRREVSIDFTLPHWFHRRRADSGNGVKIPTFVPNPLRGDSVGTNRHLVPLTFLRKGVLVNFRLRDEMDGALSLLNSAQNAQVSEALLISIAGRELGGPVPSEIRCDIRDLVRSEHHSHQGRSSPAEAARNRLFNSRDRSLEERKVLSESDLFAGNAIALAHYFLALSMLEIAPHQRRVLHFSYEEPFNESVDGGARNLIDYVRRLALGEPRVVVLSSPAVSRAHSHHLEVEAPEGHMINRRESVLFEPGDGLRSTKSSGSYRRAHFHHSHVKPRSEVAALVYLRPRPYTLVRGATGTCFLALASIAMVAWRFGNLQQEGNEVATAILLSFAGLLSLFIVRAGEQDISTTLLFPLRALLAAPIGLSFASALVVLAEPSVLLGQILLTMFAAATAGVTAVMVRNWITISGAMRAQGPVS